MEPHQEREGRLAAAERGILEEKEKQKVILGDDNEEAKQEVKTESTETSSEPKEEEFEYERLKVTIYSAKW